jgi:hypothetical protein
VSSARTTQAGGKGNSNKGNKGISDMQSEWVPLLPEARVVLLAALVHEHEGNALQGIQHAVQLLSQAAVQARAAWVEQQQQQQQQQSSNSQQQGKAAAGKQSKQQQGKASGGKQAARSAAIASSKSADASAADYTALLSLPVLKALLAACIDAVTDEQGELCDEPAALAAGNAAADLMSQLLGCSLLVMLDQQSQQGPATAAAPSSSSSALPALVTPDSEAWALLVQLFGAAGRYKWVAEIVSAATRGQLPVATPGASHKPTAAAAAAGGSGSWSASDLQCVLAAAAGVWLPARCPGLVLAMLDALAAAGGTTLDNARLAAAVNEVTLSGVSAGWTTAAVCVCVFVGTASNTVPASTSSSLCSA